MPASNTPWKIADSLETYAIRSWGLGYFGVNDRGNVAVHPYGEEKGSFDLKELIDEVRRRGIGLPLLVRFTDVLKDRVVQLNEAFRHAITEYGFKGTYRSVYPIKVNQDRHVLESIVEAATPYGRGLEAGSKPELLAVMALLAGSEDGLIICNGYKDEEYIETALYASKLGHKVVMVIEKPSELPLIVEMSRRTGIRPTIGIRIRLSTKGAGRWEASGGDRSKFGLSSLELMDCMAFLRRVDMLDTFELVHFHLGSQISNIRNIKNALREAARFYVEVSGHGAPLGYFDVGGGLGVDYDGSQTNFASSMNYSLAEYANDVVYTIREACELAEVPAPIIVSESGRALVAHHAALITEVLGVSELAGSAIPESVPDDAPQVVRNLFYTFREITNKNLLENYHDAAAYKEESLTLFSLGHLSLDERVAAENLYWASCKKILRIAREQDELPEELERLTQQLSDTYFCNFSLFQSLPDAWAIDQLFPVLPIHRLNERPTRHGVLADITCDSDGKLNRFIGRREVKDTLELHALNEDDYYLGIFLVGAYQEILGDLHNLFGDTNAVKVSLAPSGGYFIDHVVEGNSVTEVLDYVGYSRDDLVARVRRSTEDSLRAGRITLDESRTLLRIYESGLSGYTYLEREVDAKFPGITSSVRLVPENDPDGVSVQPKSAR